MVHLLLALMLAAPGTSIGENRMILRDPQQGPMPISDKFMIPTRVPDCANAEQLQRAEEQRLKGWEPDCMIPRKSNDQKPH